MANRGRRPFKATPALRRKVEKYLAGGMSRDQIALAIGCTPPTLDKHFALELQTGFARRKAAALDMLWKQAEKGNASSLRKLLDVITIAEAAGAAGNDESPAKRTNAGKDTPAKPVNPGKKALADLAAATAGEGTEWGDDLTPPEGTTWN